MEVPIIPLRLWYWVVLGEEPGRQSTREVLEGEAGETRDDRQMDDLAGLGGEPDGGAEASSERLEPRRRVQPRGIHRGVKRGRGRRR